MPLPFRPALAVLLLALGPIDSAPALAAALCEDGLTTGSAPLLTPVIDSVLRGDYRALTEAIDPAAVMMVQADRQGMIADLEALAPLGYDDCAILVARPLGPDFEVYLTMFGSDKGRLYGFLAASRIDGAWTFVHQKFSPDFAAVYDLLR